MRINRKYRIRLRWVNETISGERDVTPDTALRLSEEIENIEAIGG